MDSGSSVALRTFALDRILGYKDFDAVYQTAVGEQREIALPDQSIVTLNTATQAHVHYTASARSIELLGGEAHFAVAKHEGRVFSVRVGLNEFRAVGTAFNIRVRSGRGVALTVTEGRVQVLVSPPLEPNHIARVPSGVTATTEIMVDAGKEVEIDSATQTVEHLRPAQLDAALAWKHGMIVLDGESLESAIAEVSRYSNAHFLIPDAKTRRIPVSGYFRVGDVDGLIAALHSNFKINATRNGDSITLSSEH